MPNRCLLLLSLASLVSSMPVVNVHGYCRFHPANPSLPAGVDCYMECAQYSQREILCSFNVTEACHPRTCAEAMFGIESSSLMNSIPDDLGLMNMFKLLDSRTYRYHACLADDTVSHDEIPLKHRDYCLPCTATTRLNFHMQAVVTCSGLERFRGFQTGNENIVLALEYASQYSPSSLFTMGAEFFHLPSVPNPHNRIISSIRYFHNIDIREFDFLPKLFVHYL